MTHICVMDWGDFLSALSSVTTFWMDIPSCYSSRSLQNTMQVAQTGREVQETAAHLSLQELWAH